MKVYIIAKAYDHRTVHRDNEGWFLKNFEVFQGWTYDDEGKQEARFNRISMETYATEVEPALKYACLLGFVYFDLALAQKDCKRFEKDLCIELEVFDIESLEGLFKASLHHHGKLLN